MHEMSHEKWADFLDLVGSIIVGVIAFLPMCLLLGIFVAKMCIEDTIEDYKNKKLIEEYLND